jgi:integrase
LHNVSIALGPAAQAVLRPYLEGARPDQPVFRTRRGSAVSPDYYGKAVRTACRRAGLTPWFPYQLRHALATSALAAADWTAVQAQLGHARPDTTAHYVAVQLAAAARVVGRAG